MQAEQLPGWGEEVGGEPERLRPLPHGRAPRGFGSSPSGYPRLAGRATSLASDDATLQRLAGDALLEIAHATDTLSRGGRGAPGKLPPLPPPCPQTVAGRQLSGA